jgi:hypothetical protein
MYAQGGKGRPGSSRSGKSPKPKGSPSAAASMPNALDDSGVDREFAEEKTEDLAYQR